jgi:alanyl-tRNA synthetase
MHKALREVLGDHVQQGLAGGPRQDAFDFAHTRR